MLAGVRQAARATQTCKESAVGGREVTGVFGLSREMEGKC